jgi:hypothetical protein
VYVLLDRDGFNAVSYSVYVFRKGRGFVLLATDITTSFQMLLF